MAGRGWGVKWRIEELKYVEVYVEERKRKKEMVEGGERSREIIH